MAQQQTKIEVFFEAVGHNKVVSAMQSIGTASASLASGIQSVGSGAFNGLTRASGVASSFVSNLAGAVPVWNSIHGGIDRAVGALKAGLGTAIGFGAAAFGIFKTLTSVQDTFNSYNGMVMGLRSLNGELDKATGTPTFASSVDGKSLGDANNGDAKKTAQDLEYLNDIAVKTGQSLKTIGQAYLEIKASSDGTEKTTQAIRAAFTGISQAAVVFHMPKEKVDSALTAISQMLSRGTVQAKELHKQLAVSLPGAMKLAAESMGITQAELMARMRAGSINSLDFIQNFGTTLSKHFAQGAELLADSTYVAMGRMRGDIDNAKALIGGGGGHGLDMGYGRLINAINKKIEGLNGKGFNKFGDDIGNSLQRITNEINSVGAGANGTFLDSLASGFDHFVRFIIAGTKDVYNFGSAVKSIFTNSGGTLDASKVQDQIAQFIAGMKKIGETEKTGYFTDNGLTNFLAMTVKTTVSAGKTLASFVTGSAQSFSRGIHDRMNDAAIYVGEFGLALDYVRTGVADSRLNDVGKNIAVGLGQAKNVGNELVNVIKALFDGSYVSKNNPLEPFTHALFAARDLLIDILKLAWDNKDAIFAFAAGVGDAFGIVLRLADLLVKGLHFVGLNEGLAYFIGIWFALTKITGLITGLGPILAGFIPLVNKLVSAWKATALWIGISSLEMGLLVGLVAALLVTLYEVVKNWDEVSSRASALWAEKTGDKKRAEEIGAAFELRQEARSGKQAKAAEEKAKNGATDGKLDSNGFISMFKNLSGLGDGSATSEIDKQSITTTAAKGMANSGPVAIEDTSISALVDQTRAAMDGKKKKDPLAAGQQAAAEQNNTDQESSSNAPNDGFGQPVNIYLQDGTSLAMRGRNEDSGMFASLAAKTAANQQNQAPAWAD